MGNRKELHVTKQKFDEFVLAHGRDILWFCRMTAGNAHEGDELYQDTMLTLLEHLDRLDEKNNSKSYALSVAIRLWKNRRRKFAWRMRIAPQESYEVHIQNGGEASETRNADPEVQVLQEETIHEVQKLVQQLPEKYRLDRKAMMRMEIFVRQDSCVLSRTCMKSVLNLHLFFSEHKVIRMCSILKWTWIFDNGSHRQ